MNYLKPLITLNYWFDLSPAPFINPAMIALGIALAVIFIGGIIVKWLGYKARKNPPMHRVFSRIGRALVSVAVVAIFIYFFSYEQIYFISARFWWAAIFVWAVVWAAFIALDIMKNYSREKDAFAEKNRREKYLPK